MKVKVNNSMSTPSSNTPSPIEPQSMSSISSGDSGQGNSSNSGFTATMHTDNAVNNNELQCLKLQICSNNQMLKNLCDKILNIDVKNILLEKSLEKVN